MELFRSVISFKRTNACKTGGGILLNHTTARAPTRTAKTVPATTKACLLLAAATPVQLLALRDILRRRASLVAFGSKRTANGKIGSLGRE
jgi:hypothetical protein